MQPISVRKPLFTSFLGMTSVAFVACACAADGGYGELSATGRWSSPSSDGSGAAAGAPEAGPCAGAVTTGGCQTW